MEEDAAAGLGAADTAAAGQGAADSSQGLSVTPTLQQLKGSKVAVRIWCMDTLDPDAGVLTPSASQLPSPPGLPALSASAQRESALGTKVIRHVGSSWLAQHMDGCAVLHAFLSVTPGSASCVAIGAFAAQLQRGIAAAFDSRCLTASLRQLLDLACNDAATVQACVQLNAALVPPQAGVVSAAAAAPPLSGYDAIAKAWVDMGPRAIILHQLIHRDLMRLHTLTLHSIPKSRKAAAKAAKKAAAAEQKAAEKAAEKAAAAAAVAAARRLALASAAGPSGSHHDGATPTVHPEAALPLPSPALDATRDTYERIGGWLATSGSGRGQTDKVLRDVAACMVDKSGSISRPEHSAFNLLQAPGSKRLGAKDLVKPHPRLVDFLVVMHKELGAIMDLSSILSLRSVAFITWERLLERSRTLWAAWLRMIAALPLPDALRQQLDDARLRRLQGVFVQKVRNALVDEILAWNAAGKPGEDTADLSLRDSLKGRSLKAAGDGEEAAGKSAVAARKRPKPTVATVPLSQFYAPAQQPQQQQQQQTLAPEPAALAAPPTVARRAVPVVPKAACPHRCSSCPNPQRENGQQPTACSKCKACCYRDRAASEFALTCGSHIAGMKAAAAAKGGGKAAAGPSAQ